MFEYAEQSISTATVRVNIPCTRGASLLKPSTRAAQCMADRDRVRPHPLFRASPCFEKKLNRAFGFALKRNQLVGVRAGDAPTETTVFDLMVTQFVSRKKNLPRRFLRENAGAKTTNTNLKSKGRAPRQENE